MDNLETAALTTRYVDPETLDWDDSVEVIVVGYGGAGACAALAARAAGASVLVLERFGGGGATARSGGVVYAGATAVQRAAGIGDDPEGMFRYLERETNGAVPTQVLRAYCDGSADYIDWLVRLGLEYNTAVYRGKTDYPAGGESLYFAGNETRADNAALTAPVPRGHRPAGRGFTGHRYFAALARAVDGSGARVVAHAPVCGLLRDAAGRVVGVEARVLPDSAWRRHQRLCDRVGVKPFNDGVARRARAEAQALELRLGQIRRYRARGGVVLAAGGYASNPAMLHQYNPRLAPHTGAMIHLATLGCDGSGIRLGQSVSGATTSMQNLQIVRNLSPESLREGLLINARGERFINEDAYNGDLGKAIALQLQGRAWLVLGLRAYLRALRDCLSVRRGSFLYFSLPALVTLLCGGTRFSRSLAGLARRCGWDPARFARQVEEWNATVRRSDPDPRGKATDTMRVLGPEPWIAVDVSIGNPLTFTFMFTLGGLSVDPATGAVRDGDGRAIAGLYAAGRTAAGLCSNGYVSGLSLGDGIFSGRRAGAHAARAPGGPAA